MLSEGKLAEIDAIRTEFTQDEQFNQNTIEVRIHDSAGRITRLTGEHYAHFPLVPGPHTVLNEGAMRCEINGKPGVGWSEFMWPSAYLQHLRNTAY